MNASRHRHPSLVALAILTCLAMGCGGDDRAGSGAAADQSYSLGSCRLQVDREPPRLRFFDEGGRLITQSAPGILQIVRVETVETWFQAFLAVARDELEVTDLRGGTAEASAAGEVIEIKLRDAGRTEAASLRITGAAGRGLTLEVETAPPGVSEPGDREVHFRFLCLPDEGFYGFGGQTDAAQHRGHTIPIRVTEAGLTKDPNLPESQWSIVGHLHEAYFPLPYALIAHPDPGHGAYGLLLDTDRRSRFLLCSEEEDVMEIQAPVEPDGAGGGCARLHLLPGPEPRDVVRQYTEIQGRQPRLPRWAFGPWVAIKGEPLEVADLARALDEHDVAATAVWDQDWRSYEHPDLSEMAVRLHALGLRVLTYFNSFLDERELSDPEEPISRGFAPERPGGGPYRFLRVLTPSSVLDFTDPAARRWMADRLAAAYRLGLDGWMADYGEWVAPDMRFEDGRTGRNYANRYPVDWAELNDEVARAERPDGDAVYFHRSGYLGSNPYLRVVWAGDQQTDWGKLDGLPSVVPYGTSLGLAGVSAFGSDIAGYTGIVSPPTTKELYLRWLALGAFSPVMRTHRGNNWQENWNWDRDAETLARFREYSVLHLRLLPYLTALHDEAVRSGLPAMRHVLLEFPGWEGAARADHVFLLGPALFVAPVLERRTTVWKCELPPGRWYRWEDGQVFDGPGEVTVPAAPGEIPVFLRAGGIVPMLPDSVRRLERVEGQPPGWSVEEVEGSALEVVVGAGGESSFALSDGTGISLARAGDLPPDLTVRLEETAGDPGPRAGSRHGPEGQAGQLSAAEDLPECPAGQLSPAEDLPECPPGRNPPLDDCWSRAQEGLVILAARSGPGEIQFGAAVAGEPVRLRIAGGPTERRTLIRLVGGHTGGR